MKKILSVICALMMCFAVAGCGNAESKESETNNESETLDLKQVYNDAIRIINERYESDLEYSGTKYLDDVDVEEDYSECKCADDGSFIEIELKYEDYKYEPGDFSSFYSEKCALYSENGIEGEPDYSQTMETFEAVEDLKKQRFTGVVSKYADLVDAINELLGLPESFSNKIGRTSGADGKQTQEFDDFIVTWSYYENDHFYIIYEMK